MDLAELLKIASKLV